MNTKPPVPVYDEHTIPDMAQDTRFFGHPRGLSTLFFIEMWERFSYYGMRAILILFMTAKADRLGLNFSDSKAGAIYGMYTAMVYLLSLPGGWFADRIVGQQRAVLYGGIIIALGHFTLAVPTESFFYLGLVLITIGTGLLKPNASTIVGQLYQKNDPRRDAGFSIFYMGVNLGALIAPLIVGYVGERINWHYGFAIAGIAMTIGLVQYVAGWKNLGNAGREPYPAANEAEARQTQRQLWIGLGSAALVVALLAGLTMSGMLALSVKAISNLFGVALTVTVVAVFAVLFRSARDTGERRRLGVILVLFIAAALFWAIFEQAGSTLNLFADRNTDLHFLGYSFPASWFQSVNSIFLIVFAPIFAWVWIRLGPNDPSIPAKFTAGLLFAGLGVLILLPVAGLKGVSPMWLVMTYLLHTIGELCLSPVGLSAMTKLAPTRIVGLMMGVWFAAISVGDFIAGQVASVSEQYSYGVLFSVAGGLAVVFAVILALLIKPLKAMMGEVH